MGRRSVAGMLKLERVISVVVRRVRSLAVVELENLALRHQRSPWQKAYVERVIGSIRRECLDHIVIFNERHLRRVLSSYIDYYQRTRTHLSLDKDCPDPRPIMPRRIGKVIPSLRSAACIIATNASPPDSSPIPAHQSLRGGRYAVVRRLCIGGFSISIRGEPLVVQIAARLT